MDVRGRTALVTGATGGLGHAIARALAARGATLILTGRRAELLAPLASETGARAIPCDLADPAAVRRLVGEAGEVDVLVANAGLPGSGHISTFSAEDIDRALAVNLRAPMVLARELSGPMAARGSGHIVFVSSLSGKVASGGGSVYAATKFGLRGFAHGLREDLRDSGMFHDSGVTLPGFVGTKSPGDVADAVLRAIERDRAELDVAPVGLRVGAAFAGLAPELSARLQRRLGGAAVSEAMARGQQDKRA